ncbi:hypothetical protein PR048_027876 [Dryococelus australis]|uniref:HTH CENPB-type domain-containing protein n=1 Tax=Dryococelus australis TaxID=614101 RepID=A0ABQ9GHM6_9NEOP|nr:hypothetical protein PR048_027876 [Dryococelus australis]
MICEKALQFNEQLNGLKDFKVSSGWHKNFESRHGISVLDVEREKLSSDLVAGSVFKEKFIKAARRGDVYNADETGINWRALPRKSLESRREKSAPGFKVSKERITAMVCANAIGEHMVKLLVIGKSKKPCCFKNVQTLPVSVTTFCEEKKRSGKVLIIDNTPIHPRIEVVNKIDQNFEVQFLPPNVTTLQPMDQGVIKKMKRIYRQQLLHRLLLAEKDEERSSSVY